jgi:hypothetical protein
VRAAEGVRGEATRQKEGGNRVEIGQKSRQIRGKGGLPEGPSSKTASWEMESQAVSSKPGDNGA